MPTLNQLLENAYGNQSLTWSPNIRRRLLTPEATRDLPEPETIEPAFQQQALTQNLEGGKPWPILDSIWGGTQKVLHALSAGEYAIASTIREVIDEQRQADDVDPVSAFFKGLAAGFNDDEEFKTTMYDVLGSAGWNPDNTSGKIGKAVLGFGLSLLVDPLTYTGLGALKVARVGRIATKELKGLFAEFGKNIPAKVMRTRAGDQYLTKEVGQKVLKHFESIRKGNIEKTEDVVGDLHRNVTASQSAVQDTALSALPFDVPWEEAYKLKTRVIGGKDVNVVDEALKALGKEPTKPNIKWWMEEGYKKAWDPGGLKIGIPFTEIEGHIWPNRDIFGPKYLGFIGAAVGNAVRNHVPFAAQAEKAIKDNKWYKSIVEDYIGGKIDGLKEKFSSMRGLSASERLVQGEVKKAFQRIDADGDMIAAGTQVLDATEEAGTRFGSVRMKTWKNGTDVLTPGEDILSGIIAKDISSHFGTDILSNLRPWLKKVLIDNPDIPFKNFAKEHGVELTEKTVDRLATVIPRYFDLENQVFKLGQDIGKPIRQLEAYFPLQFDEVAQKYKVIGKGKNPPLLDPAILERETQGLRVHEMLLRPLGYGKGEIAAHPILSARQSMQRSVKIALRDAFVHHAMSRYPGIYRHGIRTTGEGSREWDQFARERLNALGKEEGKAWTYHLAESSKGKFAGLPVDSVKAFFSGLKRARNSDDVAVVTEEFLNTAPGSLTDANIDFIKNAWDDIGSLHDRNVAEGITKSSSARQAMNEAQGEFFTRLEEHKLFNTLEDNANRAIEQAETINMTSGISAIPEGQSAKMMETAKDIVGKAKSLGIERHVPAMLEEVGFTGDATNATLADLERLKDILYSPKKSSVISDLLKPAPEGFVKPEMLGRVKIKDPVTGSTLKPITDFVMEPKMLNELQQYISPDNLEKVHGSIYHIYSWGTNQLKKLLTGAIIPGVMRPSFFARNFIDQYGKRMMGLSTEAGMGSWEDTVHAFQISTGQKGSFLFRGVETTYDQMREFLETLPMWNSGWGSLGLAKSEAQNILGTFSEPASTAYALRRQAFMAKHSKLSATLKAVDPMRMGSLQDNLFIAEAAIAQSKRGVPWAEAVENMRRNLFDYSNLTSFEKGISNLVMFYGFQRQALPFVLRQLADKPVLFNVMDRVRDMNWDNPKEEALVPKWVRDYPHVRMTSENGKIKVASLRNIFTLDSMSDMFPMNVGEFVGKLNPLASLPLELMIGRDIYLNNEIPETKYIQQEMSKVPEWTPFLNARTVNAADGKNYLAVDGYNWHILRRTWFSRLFREADTIGQTFQGQQEPYQAMMNFMLGVKLYQYDIEKQMSFIEKEASTAKSLYNDALKKGDRQRAVKILKELRDYTATMRQ